MKAIVIPQPGGEDELILEEIASPGPGTGEVLIDVHACGVNFPDALIIRGLYQVKPPFPFSPGCEVAGVVSEVGDDVEALAVGDRVIAWLGYGGFAEQAVAPVANVARIPAELDFITAAAFLMTYGTSHYALSRRAALAAGETLVVLGAGGGVGLAAVELGKAGGARVIACASSAEKLALARDKGADELVNYTDTNLKDAIKELTGGQGADVVYDPVGGALAEPALRTCGWGGRYLVIGFASGDIPSIPLNLVLLKSCQIVGVFWGAYLARDPASHREDVAVLLAALDEGRIRPHVSRVYPLAETPAAIRAIGNREALGKLVVQVRS